MAAGAAAVPAAPPTTRIEADRMEGRTEAELHAIGQARMERGETVMTADRFFLDQITNDLHAEGRVVLTKPGETIRGPRALLNLDTYFGEFYTPNYEIVRARSQRGEPDSRRQLVLSGESDLLRLEGENQYRFDRLTYSSCPAPDPDWYLRASTAHMDFDRNTGVATNASVWLKGVPILWTPWAEFPLDGGRQSGFLPPVIATGNTTGLDISAPYYLNLAPNYDATIAPRWMADRGAQLSGEFRYLNPGFFGVFRSEMMPQDKQTGEARSFTTWRHDYNTSGWNGFVDVSNASDEFYFSDMGTRLSTSSQTLLSRQITANTAGAGWTFGLNMQNYQTLAGYTGDEPYQRLPQLTGKVSLPDVKGVSLLMPMELTRFAHTTLDEGTRTWLYPQVALPVQGSAYYLTPKVGVHLSQYQLDRRQSIGEESVGRAVPSFTFDTGLNFERDIDFQDRAQIQTLEPRLFYVRMPYRAQDDIPVFDSGLADYNFAQIFAENRFAGNDRIGDANQLTAAVTSRLIEADSGEEWLRGALGQRFHFADQNVTMGATNTQPTRNNDNWLAALSGRVTRRLWLDTGYEYDPVEARTQSGVLATRYTLEPGRVVSAAYRYRQGNLRDFDLSGQWRVGGGYSVVGRYNYNMRDHQMSESLAGLEYNAGCWALRMVWHSVVNTRTDTTAGKAEYTSGFFIQLQLDGLSAIGSSPTSLLKRNVGGYQRMDGSAAVSDE